MTSQGTRQCERICFEQEVSAPRATWLAVSAVLICAILVSADALASYRPELPVATPADGAAYLVSDILPRYVEEHPDHPPLDSDLEVELGEVSDGYVAPREDVPSARIRLKRPERERRTCSASTSSRTASLG